MVQLPDSVCIVSAADYAAHWTEEERMRHRCEASGLKVKRDARGHGRCPLCEDDWHSLTPQGRLRTHARLRNRELTPQEIERRLEAAAAEADA
jgi:hypothetical protein